MITRIVAAACVLLGVGALPAAAQPRGGDPDSIALRVEDGRRWRVRASTEVAVEIVNHSTERTFAVTSAALHLPSDARCSAGTEPAEAYNAGMLVEPGARALLWFRLECIRTAGLLAGSTDATVTARLRYPEGLGEPPRTETRNVQLAWIAPWWLVLAGAVIGVFAGYTLLLLLGRTGRAGRPSYIAPAAVEVVFGMVVAAIMVMLLRTAHGILPAPLNILVADSFGHGFALGLTYDALGHELAAWMTRRRAEENGKPDDAAADEPDDAAAGEPGGAAAGVSGRHEPTPAEENV